MVGGARRILQRDGVLRIAARRLAKVTQRLLEAASLGERGAALEVKLRPAAAGGRLRS